MVVQYAVLEANVKVNGKTQNSGLPPLQNPRANLDVASNTREAFKSLQNGIEGQRIFH